MSNIAASIVIGGVIIAGGILLKTPVERKPAVKNNLDGVVIPVVWGDLGLKLVESGVIDVEKFIGMYEGRGQFTDEYRRLLLDKDNDQLKVTKENAGFLLNVLWALGLGNKSPILEEGEMANPRYGGAGNFASTGGWTLARGQAMDHYSMHGIIELTPEEERLVDKVSRKITRPCCSNSAHFPDCNHGMAMLGLLELMASQGMSEEEMHRNAILVNSYWFPGYYDEAPSSSGGCSV
ncbi:MAG: hypothetical protein Q8O98_02800 [bacterium]|nr:hypothetical protein [bacterium]